MHHVGKGGSKDEGKNSFTTMVGWAAGLSRYQSPNMSCTIVMRRRVTHGQRSHSKWHQCVTRTSPTWCCSVTSCAASVSLSLRRAPIWALAASQLTVGVTVMLRARVAYLQQPANRQPASVW